jgi:dihydropyrimidinase
MLTRPSIMEGEAAHRVIRIAELAEMPVYIVHLSSEDALEAVVEARDRGIHAFAETCPHYLFLTSPNTIALALRQPSM